VVIATPDSTSLRIGERTIHIDATPLPDSPQKRLGIISDQLEPHIFQIKGTTYIDVSGPFLLTLLFLPLGAMTAFVLGYIGWVLCLCVSIGGIGTLCLCLRLAGRPLASLVRKAPRWSVSIGRDEREIAGEILAIQLLPGRLDEDLHEAHPGIQLKLVTDDPQQPRLGFITFRGVKWTRAAGWKLANYLGVPLVDHLR
jgi:hypothetical protein